MNFINGAGILSGIKTKIRIVNDIYFFTSVLNISLKSCTLLSLIK